MEFRDLLSKYNIETLESGHHHCRPGFVQFDCPHCSPDSKKYRMGYNLEHRYTNCWVCGYHNLASTIAAITGGRLSSAIVLAKEILPDLTEKVEESKRTQLVLPRGVSDLKKPHLRYLREKRKFTSKEIMQLTTLWKLQGIGISSQLPWRIFIPFIHKGMTVSWTTRSLSEKGTRYISASGYQERVNHKRILYGEDYCRNSIIVHEGPIDVWRTGPGSVAICGLTYSTEQVFRIAKYPVRIICFDNSKDADDRAEKLTETLGSFQGDTFKVTLDSEDAGSATKKETRRLRKLAGLD